MIFAQLKDIKSTYLVDYIGLTQEKGGFTWMVSAELSDKYSVALHIFNLFLLSPGIRGLCKGYPTADPGGR